MKKIPTLLFLLGILIFAACSSDSGSDTEPEDPDPVVTDPVVTTQAVTINPANNTVKFNGTVEDEGSEGYHHRGFCWSANTNPTTSDNYVYSDGSGEGPYFYNLTLGLELQMNTTYNIRAFVESNVGGTFYGNNITYTTPNIFSVSTFTVKEIYAESATFYGTISSNQAGNTAASHKGFCYSTSANPTIANGTVIEGTNELGDYSLVAYNLNPNTTYHVRAFGYDESNNVIYGEDVTFHTMGYPGVSGGFVYYDKGEMTNGWRYLEAAPANLPSLYKWGCAGSWVNGTSQAIGSGLENTNKILAACSDTNCAARAAANYSVNGIDDWFLPSYAELFAMYDSLVNITDLSNSTNQVQWSSSEYSAGYAHFVNTYYGTAIPSGVSKSNNNLVRPIRRF